MCWPKAGWQGGRRPWSVTDAETENLSSAAAVAAAGELLSPFFEMQLTLIVGRDARCPMPDARSPFGMFGPTFCTGFEWPTGLADDSDYVADADSDSRHCAWPFSVQTFVHTSSPACPVYSIDIHSLASQPQPISNQRSAHSFLGHSLQLLGAQLG